MLLLATKAWFVTFLYKEPTGETKPHPFNPTQQITIATAKTPENQKIVEETSQRLGVVVEIYDYVYDIALRLAAE